jgi:hypothetical protein
LCTESQQQVLRTDGLCIVAAATTENLLALETLPFVGTTTELAHEQTEQKKKETFDFDAPDRRNHTFEVLLLLAAIAGSSCYALERLLLRTTKDQLRVHRWIHLQQDSRSFRLLSEQDIIRGHQ